VAAVVLLIAMLGSIILTTRLVLVEGKPKPEEKSANKLAEKPKAALIKEDRGILIDFMEQRALEEKYF
jgi:hypothetical protein